MFTTENLLIAGFFLVELTFLIIPCFLNPAGSTRTAKLEKSITTLRIHDRSLKPTRFSRFKIPGVPKIPDWVVTQTMKTCRKVRYGQSRSVVL